MKYPAADRWLFYGTAAYCVMNGAQLWETAVMIPAWTEAPPASLVFFHGPYGLDFKQFWIAVHSVHEVIFLLSLVFNWKVRQRRAPMLLLFLAHIAVRVWTLLYFAPTIVEFQQIPYSAAVDPQLAAEAALWRTLNYLRVGLFFAVNLGLALLFIYPATRNES